MVFLQIFITFVVIILLDLVYLLSTKDFFNNIVKEIQGSNISINYLGVISCYIFIVLGLNLFIINENKSILYAFLLGIMVYGVYDTTNYAIFDKWPETAVVMDVLWGGILFALTTVIVNLIFNKKIYFK